MKLRIEPLVVVVALFAFACNSSSPAPETVAVQQPPATSPAVIAPNGERIVVEIAADDATRAQGLMFRSSLTPGTGMLFIFASETPQGFWMKNTIIPLDMVWIDGAGRIIDVKTAVPCKADPCPSYDPRGPAEYVLEIAAGEAKRYGFMPGASVKIEHVSGYSVR